MFQWIFLCNGLKKISFKYGNTFSLLYNICHFGSILVSPCALVSCHILISKQEDDGASGHSSRQVCNWKGIT